MSTEVFHPDIIRSPALLTRFLSGQKEIAEILTAPRTPYPSRLSDRWDVSCLTELTEIYHLFNACLLAIVSYALYGLCLTSLSKRVWVIHHHEYAQATILNTQKVFKNNFLTSSVNIHAKNTADLYLHRSIAANPADQNSAEFTFFCSDGICRGMAFWLVYLYFKTRHQFTNPQEHLCALGRQFEQGASRQAALIQTLTSLDDNFVRNFYPFLQLNCAENYLTIDFLQESQDQILQRIQQCPAGVYALYVGGHMVVYIKDPNGQEFLFDANKGVIRLESTLLFKQATKRYWDEHDPTKRILFDRYTPRGQN
jgi:hypothetical protein